MNYEEQTLGALRQAASSGGGSMGFSLFMSKTSGGHTCQAFGQRSLTVDYKPGSPALGEAQAIFLGRPFIPVGRPFFLPLNPGSNNFPGTSNFGAGVVWTYGGGNSATFSWNLDGIPQCSNGWGVVDTINSPTSASIQIACGPAGTSWVLAAQLIPPVPGTVTLFADGVSQGPVIGNEMTVTGAVISLGIELELTSATAELSLGYSIQSQ